MSVNKDVFLVERHLTRPGTEGQALAWETILPSVSCLLFNHQAFPRSDALLALGSAHCQDFTAVPLCTMGIVLGMLCGPNVLQYVSA